MSQTPDNSPPINEADAIVMAKRLAARGLTVEQILSELVADGVDSGIATFVVLRHTQAPRSEHQQSATIRMALGSLLILLGIGLLAFLYFRVEQDETGVLPDLGLLFLACLKYLGYGMLFAGMIQFIRGLSVPRR